MTEFSCPTAQSEAASSIARSWQRVGDSRCCIGHGLACPAGLGEGPAVVIVEFGQQAVDHATVSQPRLPAGRTHSDPRHQVIKQARVPVMAYRGSSGCRVIDLFRKLA